jgi:hypothetical protein
MSIFKAKSQLEEDMLDRMGKKMAQEIDSEIISSMLLESLIHEGWTPTKVNPAFTDMGMLSGRFEEWYSQTAEWVHLNAQGEYRLLKGQWLFKDPRDATMFILRWL